MKKVIRLTFLFLFLFSFFMTNVMALHPDVLVNKGYDQVINVGGINIKNINGSSDGVSVSKIVEETDLENYFDITLEVNSYSKVEQILKDQDLAIVIVMDISNSMNTIDVTDGSKKISRLDAAQSAANKFIDDFKNYSKNVNASRKLGFVAFNTNGHEIFSLQDCKTDEEAINLKNKMETDTDKIALKDGYHTSSTRFTNIEAGLKKANEMLSNSVIQNKYIIFISDGFPSTYIKSDYTGYNPYMWKKYNNSFIAKDEKNENTFGYSESSNGIFFNEFSKLICKDGTNYSDEAARRASSQASSIKKKGIKIFSVGISISDDRKIDKTSYLTDVDIEKYNAKGNFEVGSNGEQYKNWLKNFIGSGYYYDTTDTLQLSDAYAKIFEQVKAYSNQSSITTWVVDDPMGGNGSISTIEFVGLFDDTNSYKNLHDSIKNDNVNQSNTANYTNNRISWDLKNSKCTESVDSNNTKIYKYQIKYRIRLKNELPGFDINNIYNTNNPTRLTYIIRKDGVLSENKYIDFPIPQVVGYLGNFNFFKKSSFDGSNLSGAKFRLEHDPNCLCHNQRRYVTKSSVTYEVMSYDGMVNFSNIPSGHKYILTEIEAPYNHVLSNDSYNIEIINGDVFGIENGMEFINEINTTSLEIEKTVLGKASSNEFMFKLYVKYNNLSIKGSVPYVITDVNGKNTSGLLNLNDDLNDPNGLIKLKNKEKIVISGLPVNSIYEIKEITTDGYDVSYIVNNDEEKRGNVARCNEVNNCYLKKNENNRVEYINTVLYLLPETGSSGMLILTIIGFLLFGIPVIYIGYLFCHRKT